MKLPAALVICTLIGTVAHYGPGAVDQFRARSLEERQQRQNEMQVVIEFPTRPLEQPAASPPKRGLREDKREASL